MKIRVTQDSILDCKTDVIVNPANPQLLRGGGLSGVIHKAAGDELFQWLKQYKLENQVLALSHGDAMMSPSFNLKCRAIIHAVGPVWKGGEQGEEKLLKQTYLKCLRLAEDNHFDSIAFPNISTGIYTFPKSLAASYVIEMINNFSVKSIEVVTFACYDQENYDLYRDLLNLI